MALLTAPDSLAIVDETINVVSKLNELPLSLALIVIIILAYRAFKGYVNSNPDVKSALNGIVIRFMSKLGADKEETNRLNISKLVALVNGLNFGDMRRNAIMVMAVSAVINAYKGLLSNVSKDNKFRLTEDELNALFITAKNEYESAILAGLKTNYGENGNDIYQVFYIKHFCTFFNPFLYIIQQMIMNTYISNIPAKTKAAYIHNSVVLIMEGSVTTMERTLYNINGELSALLNKQQ